MNKPWYSSKTLWIAVIQGIVGILVVLETNYPTVGILVLLKSILDVSIRLITELPIKNS